jgi:hypothetical protein
VRELFVNERNSEYRNSHSESPLRSDVQLKACDLAHWVGEYKCSAFAYSCTPMTQCVPVLQSECPDFLGANQQIDYKTGIMRLREFCGGVPLH